MHVSVLSGLLPRMPLRQAMQAVARIGYDGIEIRVREDYHLRPDAPAREVEAVRRLAADLGLAVPALSSNISIREGDRVLYLLEAAARLGSRGVRLALPGPYDGSLPYGTLLAEARRLLDSLIPPIASLGVQALFEIHFGTIGASPSLMARALEGYPPGPVGVIFDPANMIIEGREDWRIGLELIGPFLAHVHVKNVAWARGADSAWAWEWAPLDGGMVSWPEMIGLLRRAGYDGFLSTENFYGLDLGEATGFLGERLAMGRTGHQPSEDPIAHLAADLHYLRALLAPARDRGRGAAT